MIGQPHTSPEALIAVLVTCPACGGSEEIQDSGRASCCHQCASGYKSVALPLWEVVALNEYPEPDRQAALQALVDKAAPIRHPLLYQSGIDIPPKYAPPLRPNASDNPEMRGRIPLAPL